MSVKILLFTVVALFALVAADPKTTGTSLDNVELVAAESRSPCKYSRYRDYSPRSRRRYETIDSDEELIRRYGNSPTYGHIDVIDEDASDYYGDSDSDEHILRHGDLYDDDDRIIDDGRRHHCRHRGYVRRNCGHRECNDDSVEYIEE